MNAPMIFSQIQKQRIYQILLQTHTLISKWSKQVPEKHSKKLRLSMLAGRNDFGFGKKYLQDVKKLHEIKNQRHAILDNRNLEEALLDGFDAIIWKFTNQFFAVNTRSNWEVEDILQEFKLCLLQSAYAFDVLSGNQLSTYIFHALQNKSIVLQKENRVGFKMTPQVAQALTAIQKCQRKNPELTMEQACEFLKFGKQILETVRSVNKNFTSCFEIEIEDRRSVEEHFDEVEYLNKLCLDANLSQDEFEMLKFQLEHGRGWMKVYAQKHNVTKQRIGQKSLDLRKKISKVVKVKVE